MRIGVVVDNEFDQDVRVRGQHAILEETFGSVPVLCYDLGSEELRQSKNIERLKVDRRWRNRWFGLQNRWDKYSQFWGKAIAKFIRDNELDVIHVHDLYMAKAAKMGVNGFACKIILDLHENYPASVLTQTWTKNGLKGFLANASKWSKKEPKFLAMADHIITLSDHFALSLSTKYKISSDRFTTIPNVPNMDSYDLKVEAIPDAGRVTLCYYGGVSERRGVLWLMQKFIENGLQSKFKLKIIGPIDASDKVEFDTLLIAAGASCEYVKWITNRDLGAHLSDVHIGLCPIDKNPQHESGVANKVYQYMMFGRPVLVSNCGPQKELVEKYSCGFSYIARDERSFLECLEVLENTSLEDLISMGENGRNAVKDELNLKKVQADLLAIYQGLATDLAIEFP